MKQEPKLLEPQPPVFRATTLPEKIKSCSENANPKWMKAAHLALRRVALKSEFLITPNVLNDLQKHSKTKTHDLRAIGIVMLEAHKLGIIENAGLIRRNDKHNRGATTLWRSLIYRRKDDEQDKAVQSQPEQPTEQPNGN
jgi:hypothetical protein